MPELPEVETVVQVLRPLVKNKKITNVNLLLAKVVKEPDAESFVNLIVGQTIHDVTRKAKLIIFVLDDYVLLSHLRMEGKYYFQNINEEVNWKHVLLALELDHKYELRYHDTRRFGTFHLQKKDEYQHKKPYLTLGPEPFSNEVTISYLKNKWKKRKQKVKTALLDQTIMSGLGNIYVDETLFRAQINPETIVNWLTDAEIERIIEQAIIVLNLAIEMKGTTISTFTSQMGISGKFQNKLQVHLRKDQPCYKCGTKIIKTKVNNRGTYFCPKCQTKK